MPSVGQKLWQTMGFGSGGSPLDCFFPCACFCRGCRGCREDKSSRFTDSSERGQEARCSSSCSSSQSSHSLEFDTLKSQIKKYEKECCKMYVPCKVWNGHISPAEKLFSVQIRIPKPLYHYSTPALLLSFIFCVLSSVHSAVSCYYQYSSVYKGTRLVC